MPYSPLAETMIKVAHGETHDQLIVWVPSDKTLVAGDNFYWSFPNLSYPIQISW